MTSLTPVPWRRNHPRWEVWPFGGELIISRDLYLEIAVANIVTSCWVAVFRQDPESWLKVSGGAPECLTKLEKSSLCLANFYSRGDWRVEKTLEILLPSVGIKRSADGTGFTRFLLWGVPT